MSHRITICCRGLLVLLLALPGGHVAATTMAPRLMVRDVVIPHTEFSLSAMPGEAVPIRVAQATGDVQLRATAGKISHQDNHWVWTAPHKTGLSELSITAAGIKVFDIKAFTLRPATAIDDEELDGYEIGEYPDEPLHDMDIYLPPRGFIHLAREMLNLPVSPNFRLGQFRCKQEGGYPAFLVLREQLLLKLELILSRLREKGIQAETLHVMSGYRTPEYNDDIGNGEYSRHIYGDAADIFVDQSPRDRRMDDLNGDGKVNREDARWLANLVEEIENDPAHQELVGGLGVYTSNDYRGPFVHVDVRGFKTRWEN